MTVGRTPAAVDYLETRRNIIHLIQNLPAELSNFLQQLFQLRCN